ncbi:endonuclease/exonuclease/phosphatase family protein [Aeromicrobium sp. UC242_57]|uniref:endonuclease/exonuclease/phosphatase family protein n=1 Tax=Aeromicrobium sp. UC242_57 TaxID=3374624 RepID=UPI0037BD6410
MRIATWNVNSIRTRIDRVTGWLERNDVDVLAIQETKCREDQFPGLELLRDGLRGRPLRPQPVERGRPDLTGRPRRRRNVLRRRPATVR